MAAKPVPCCPGDKIVYADHPVTGEPVALHYNTMIPTPKWIYFGDMGEGMQPIGSSDHDDPPPPGTRTRVHCGWIEITSARAYTIDKETSTP